VQKLDDMLPLTSSAILIRLPVGVMFWKASLNALSSAATTLGFGDHTRLPLSPWPFWYVSIATRMVYGWIRVRLMSAASVIRSQMALTEEGVAEGVMMPISAVLSLPKFRMSAVRGIPFPLPLAPLLWRSASQTFLYLKSCDGSCSRQRPTWLMRWTIRSSSWVFALVVVVVVVVAAAGWRGLSAMVWISLMALSNCLTRSAVGGAVARIGSNSSLVLNTCSIASRPPSSFIRDGLIWMSVRTSLMVQPSRFWYLVIRLAISIPERE